MLKALLPVALLALAGCSTRSNFAVASRSDVRSSLEGVDGREPVFAANGMRLSPKVCTGIDLRPEYGTLEVRALLDFLTAQGIAHTVQRARADLVFVDLRDVGTNVPVRLRVAILKSTPDAGRELHEAILQHGHGSWGVHRANLAILGPVAELEDALAVSIKTKLACFGVLTVAGHDDDYVVPGGYSEL